MQKPCKFPAAATDAAFDRSLGDAENLGYLFVIHIFEIAKYNCFAELWGKLFERVLDADFEFEAGDVLFLGLAGVGEPVGHGGAVVLAVEGGIEGLAGAVEAGAAKVVHQEVAGEGGDPGLEAALLGVEAAEILIELEEDFLSEVFSIIAGAGEAVADGVDAAVLGDDQLLPGLRIPRHALAYQFDEYFVRSFLIWGALQLCL
jgi:hypothetical protein